MRLWSIHPKYLDRKGLVALWREAILARKVLKGETRGYKNHPQLERFKKQRRPVRAVNAYLYHVWKESCRRGYCFDKIKIRGFPKSGKIRVTKGQIAYELNHLKNKLVSRDSKKYRELLKISEPEVHPLFSVRDGPVEKWESFRPS